MVIIGKHGEWLVMKLWCPNLHDKLQGCHTKVKILWHLLWLTAWIYLLCAVWHVLCIAQWGNKWVSGDRLEQISFFAYLLCTGKLFMSRIVYSWHLAVVSVSVEIERIALITSAPCSGTPRVSVFLFYIPSSHLLIKWRIKAKQVARGVL